MGHDYSRADRRPEDRVLTMRALGTAALIALATLAAGGASAQAPAAPGAAREDAQELAKQAQNPIANLISVPFQNNTGFNYRAARADAERAQFSAGHSRSS